MDDAEARIRVLDAADELFYARGVQAVGMDELRTRAGVPLKRLYRLFPSKDDVVLGALRRRDGRWIGRLRAAVAAAPAGARLAGLFGWLADWFAEPDFRGCAFVNVYGELGEAARPVAAVVRHHKAELRTLLVEVARDRLDGHGDSADAADRLGLQLALLVEGAIALAALRPGPEPAREAHRAAEILAAAASG